MAANGGEMAVERLAPFTFSTSPESHSPYTGYVNFTEKCKDYRCLVLENKPISEYTVYLDNIDTRE